MALLLRGPVFRALVSYHHVATRQTGVAVLTDPQVTATLRLWARDNPDATMDRISRRALQLSARQLRFSTQQGGRDADSLVVSGRAHCVGYARVYCAATATIIAELNQQGRYRCEHRVAKLHLLGWNVHAYIDHPFFRDHDYASILDRDTQRSLAVDPSLHDYLRVDRVREHAKD